MFLFLALTARPSVALPTDGCCGDIPETFIWVLSFIILIGFLAVMATFVPTSNGCGGGGCDGSDGCVHVRIDERDIRLIAQEVCKCQQHSDTCFPLGGL